MFKKTLLLVENLIIIQFLTSEFRSIQNKILIFAMVENRIEFLISVQRYKKQI